MQTGIPQRIARIQSQDERDDPYHDHLHTRLHGLERTAYECTACGAPMVETVEDNRFETYAPASGRYDGILK
ncbi:hypothetical protein [Burkholderia cepacia]|uniref:hypothetical protein n=1 Tax=Burkholderia cepacia TaxID=292 RepID=UPI0018C4B7CD|nr:hypothetical protein [Burkholderia cepacia]